MAEHAVNVLRLRRALERHGFRSKRDKLQPVEAAAVKAVVNGLRKSQSLPGDDDEPDVIPPCWPVFRRWVPNTHLWVFYEVLADGSVDLWTVRDRPI